MPASAASADLAIVDRCWKVSVNHCFCVGTGVSAESRRKAKRGREEMIVILMYSGRSIQTGHTKFSTLMSV